MPADPGQVTPAEAKGEVRRAGVTGAAGGIPGGHHARARARLVRDRERPARDAERGDRVLVVVDSRDVRARPAATVCSGSRGGAEAGAERGT